MAGLKFLSHSYVFEHGPLGLTLHETAAGVEVRAVERGSMGAAVGVPLGGLLLACNAVPLGDMNERSVQKVLAKANWPIALQIVPCAHFCFKDEGPLGFTVADAQNGVIVKDVADGSKAHEAGLPIGALLVAVQSQGMVAAESVTYLNKDEVGAMLRGRPLTLQVVPRDASYLFRPKGVWSPMSRPPTY